MALTKPATKSLDLGSICDLTRTNKQLIAESALLRQQHIVLNRQVNRPNFKPLDKFRLVILASLLLQRSQVLLILQPGTLLKWHRQGFKLFWKIKSQPKKREPRIDKDTINLISKMATENPLWGAERIRGELLKLNISVSKRTIRKYMKPVRPLRPSNQNWKTFLKNHADQVWACDFLPVVDLFFGHLYAFLIVELSSRKVVHFGVTRNPTDEGTAQQLREATGYGQVPEYLIRDNDQKFGKKFQQVAENAGIEILKTPIKAPKANSICERFLRCVRQEVLDHFFILNERHLYRVLKAYVEYFNKERPYQGIGQAIPIASALSPLQGGKIVAFPVVGATNPIRPVVATLPARIGGVVLLKSENLAPSHLPLVEKLSFSHLVWSDQVPGGGGLH